MAQKKYMVFIKKNNSCIRLSEHARDLGLSYDTVLARIGRDEGKAISRRGNVLIYPPDSPIFRRVEK